MESLLSLIPRKHNHLNHRLDQVYEMLEEDDKSFFDYLRGIPNQKSFSEMNELFFSFRLKVDGLN